jgi:hypothetical protein
LPTAKQLLALGHDTPLNTVDVEWSGLNTRMSPQLPPFQCSTKLPALGPSVTLPTAKQLLVLGHDTPTSTLDLE